jgi:hypothetical protein
MAALLDVRIMQGFNELELFFKISFLQENGLCLISKPHHQYIIDLFSWDAYFFELFFDNSIGQFTAASLASDRDMEKYLQDISLADLGVYTTID